MTSSGSTNWRSTPTRHQGTSEASSFVRNFTFCMYEKSSAGCKKGKMCDFQHVSDDKRPDDRWEWAESESQRIHKLNVAREKAKQRDIDEGTYVYKTYYDMCRFDARRCCRESDSCRYMHISDGNDPEPRWNRARERLGIPAGQLRKGRSAGAAGHSRAQSEGALTRTPGGRALASRPPWEIQSQNRRQRYIREKETSSKITMAEEGCVEPGWARLQKGTGFITSVENFNAFMKYARVEMTTDGNGGPNDAYLYNGRSTSQAAILMCKQAGQDLAELRRWESRIAGQRDLDREDFRVKLEGNADATLRMKHVMLTEPEWPAVLITEGPSHFLAIARSWDGHKANPLCVMTNQSAVPQGTRDEIAVSLVREHMELCIEAARLLATERMRTIHYNKCRQSHDADGNVIDEQRRRMATLGLHPMALFKYSSEMIQCATIQSICRLKLIERALNDYARNDPEALQRISDELRAMTTEPLLRGPSWIDSVAKVFSQAGRRYREEGTSNALSCTDYTLLSRIMGKYDNEDVRVSLLTRPRENHIGSRGLRRPDAYGDLEVAKSDSSVSNNKTLIPGQEYWLELRPGNGEEHQNMITIARSIAEESKTAARRGLKRINPDEAKATIRECVVVKQQAFNVPAPLMEGDIAEQDPNERIIVVGNAPKTYTWGTLDENVTAREFPSFENKISINASTGHVTLNSSILHTINRLQLMSEEDLRGLSTLRCGCREFYRTHSGISEVPRDMPLVQSYTGPHSSIYHIGYEIIPIPVRLPYGMPLKTGGREVWPVSRWPLIQNGSATDMLAVHITELDTLQSGTIGLVYSQVDGNYEHHQSLTWGDEDHIPMPSLGKMAGVYVHDVKEGPESVCGKIYASEQKKFREKMRCTNTGQIFIGALTPGCLIFEANGKTRPVEIMEELRNYESWLYYQRLECKEKEAITVCKASPAYAEGRSLTLLAVSIPHIFEDPIVHSDFDILNSLPFDEDARPHVYSAPIDLAESHIADRLAQEDHERMKDAKRKLEATGGQKTEEMVRRVGKDFTKEVRVEDADRLFPWMDRREIDGYDREWVNVFYTALSMWVRHGQDGFRSQLDQLDPNREGSDDGPMACRERVCGITSLLVTVCTSRGWLWDNRTVVTKSSEVRDPVMIGNIKVRTAFSLMIGKIPRDVMVPKKPVEFEGRANCLLVSDSGLVAFEVEGEARQTHMGTDFVLTGAGKKSAVSMEDIDLGYKIKHECEGGCSIATEDWYQYDEKSNVSIKRTRLGFIERVRKHTHRLKTLSRERVNNEQLIVGIFLSETTVMPNNRKAPSCDGASKPDLMIENPMDFWDNCLKGHVEALGNEAKKHKGLLIVVGCPGQMFNLGRPYTYLVCQTIRTLQNMMVPAMDASRAYFDGTNAVQMLVDDIHIHAGEKMTNNPRSMRTGCRTMTSFIRDHFLAGWLVNFEDTAPPGDWALWAEQNIEGRGNDSIKQLECDEAMGKVVTVDVVIPFQEMIKVIPPEPSWWEPEEPPWWNQDTKRLYHERMQAFMQVARNQHFVESGRSKADELRELAIVARPSRESSTQSVKDKYPAMANRMLSSWDPDKPMCYVPESVRGRDMSSRKTRQAITKEMSDSDALELLGAPVYGLEDKSAVLQVVFLSGDNSGIGCLPITREQAKAQREYKTRAEERIQEWKDTWQQNLAKVKDDVDLRGVCLTCLAADCPGSLSSNGCQGGFGPYMVDNVVFDANTDSAAAIPEKYRVTIDNNWGSKTVRDSRYDDNGHKASGISDYELGELPAKPNAQSLEYEVERALSHPVYKDDSAFSAGDLVFRLVKPDDDCDMRAKGMTSRSLRSYEPTEGDKWDTEHPPSGETQVKEIIMQMYVGDTTPAWLGSHEFENRNGHRMSRPLSRSQPTTLSIDYGALVNPPEGRNSPVCVSTPQVVEIGVREGAAVHYQRLRDSGEVQMMLRTIPHESIYHALTFGLEATVKSWMRPMGLRMLTGADQVEDGASEDPIHVLLVDLRPLNRSRLFNAELREPEQDRWCAPVIIEMGPEASKGLALVVTPFSFTDLSESQYAVDAYNDMKERQRSVLGKWLAEVRSDKSGIFVNSSQSFNLMTSIPVLTVVSRSHDGDLSNPGYDVWIHLVWEGANGRHYTSSERNSSDEELYRMRLYGSDGQGITNSGDMDIYDRDTRKMFHIAKRKTQKEELPPIPEQLWMKDLAAIMDNLRAGIDRTTNHFNARFTNYRALFPQLSPGSFLYDFCTMTGHGDNLRDEHRQCLAGSMSTLISMNYLNCGEYLRDLLQMPEHREMHNLTVAGKANLLTLTIRDRWDNTALVPVIPNQFRIDQTMTAEAESIVKQVKTKESCLRESNDRGLTGDPSDTAYFSMVGGFSELKQRKDAVNDGDKGDKPIIMPKSLVSMTVLDVVGRTMVAMWAKIGSELKGKPVEEDKCTLVIDMLNCTVSRRAHRLTMKVRRKWLSVGVSQTVSSIFSNQCVLHHQPLDEETRPGKLKACAKAEVAAPHLDGLKTSYDVVESCRTRVSACDEVHDQEILLRSVVEEEFRDLFELMFQGTGDNAECVSVSQHLVGMAAFLGVFTQRYPWNAHLTKRNAERITVDDDVGGMVQMDVEVDAEVAKALDDAEAITKDRLSDPTTRGVIITPESEERNSDDDHIIDALSTDLDIYVKGQEDKIAGALDLVRSIVAGPLKTDVDNVQYRQFGSRVYGITDCESDYDVVVSTCVTCNGEVYSSFTTQHVGTHMIGVMSKMVRDLRGQCPVTFVNQSMANTTVMFGYHGISIDVHLVESTIERAEVPALRNTEVAKMQVEELSEAERKVIRAIVVFMRIDGGVAKKRDGGVRQRPKSIHMILTMAGIIRGHPNRTTITPGPLMSYVLDALSELALDQHVIDVRSDRPTIDMLVRANVVLTDEDQGLFACFRMGGENIEYEHCLPIHISPLAWANVRGLAKGYWTVLNTEHGSFACLWKYVAQRRDSGALGTVTHPGATWLLPTEEVERRVAASAKLKVDEVMNDYAHHQYDDPSPEDVMDEDQVMTSEIIDNAFEGASDSMHKNVYPLQFVKERLNLGAKSAWGILGLMDNTDVLTSLEVAMLHLESLQIRGSIPAYGPEADDVARKIDAINVAVLTIKLSEGIPGGENGPRPMMVDWDKVLPDLSHIRETLAQDRSDEARALILRARQEHVELHPHEITAPTRASGVSTSFEQIDGRRLRTHEAKGLNQPIREYSIEVDHPEVDPGVVDQDMEPSTNHRKNLSAHREAMAIARLTRGFSGDWRFKEGLDLGERSLFTDKVLDVTTITANNASKRFPINDCRPELLRAICSSDVVLVQSSTGSGKSTQVPRMAVEAGLAFRVITVVDPNTEKSRDIVVRKPVLMTGATQIAVDNLASRMSEESGMIIGRDIGILMKEGSSMSNDECKILIATEGVFLKILLEDPSLSAFSIVILDEIHRNTIATDLAIVLIKRTIQLKLGRDKGDKVGLKLILMSATVNQDRLVNYFNRSGLTCHVVSAAGSPFPVEVVYLAKPTRDYIKSVVASVKHCYENEGEGNILIFVAGAFDSTQVVTALKAMIQDSAPIMKLDVQVVNSRIQKQIQSALNAPTRSCDWPGAPPAKTVYVSTNVAETSVTLKDIGFVIDTGSAMMETYDFKSDSSSLTRGPISKQSAGQRTGRAGRTSKGLCIRLYTYSTYCGLKEDTTPEIRGAKLDQLMLTMISLNYDPTRVDYIRAPEPEAVIRALEGLSLAGLITRGMDITSAGRTVQKIPVDPHFAAFCIIAMTNQCLSMAADLIAVTHDTHELFDECEMSVKKSNESLRASRWESEAGDGKWGHWLNSMAYVRNLMAQGVTIKEQRERTVPSRRGERSVDVIRDPWKAACVELGLRKDKWERRVSEANTIREACKKIYQEENRVEYEEPRWEDLMSAGDMTRLRWSAISTLKQHIFVRAESGDPRFINLFSGQMATLSPDEDLLSGGAETVIALRGYYAVSKPMIACVISVPTKLMVELSGQFWNRFTLRQTSVLAKLDMYQRITKAGLGKNRSYPPIRAWTVEHLPEGLREKLAWQWNDDIVGALLPLGYLPHSNERDDEDAASLVEGMAAVSLDGSSYESIPADYDDESMSLDDEGSVLSHSGVPGMESVGRGNCIQNQVAYPEGNDNRVDVTVSRPALGAGMRVRNYQPPRSGRHCFTKNSTPNHVFGGERVTFGSPSIFEVVSSPKDALTSSNAKWRAELAERTGGRINTSSQPMVVVPCSHLIARQQSAYARNLLSQLRRLTSTASGRMMSIYGESKVTDLKHFAFLDSTEVVDGDLAKAMPRVPRNEVRGDETSVGIKKLHELVQRSNADNLTLTMQGHMPGVFKTPSQVMGEVPYEQSILTHERKQGMKSKSGDTQGNPPDTVGERSSGSAATKAFVDPLMDDERGNVAPEKNGKEGLIFGKIAQDGQHDICTYMWKGATTPILYKRMALQPRNAKTASIVPGRRSDTLGIQPTFRKIPLWEITGQQERVLTAGHPGTLNSASQTAMDSLEGNEIEMRHMRLSHTASRPTQYRFGFSANTFGNWTSIACELCGITGFDQRQKASHLTDTKCVYKHMQKLGRTCKHFQALDHPWAEPDEVDMPWAACMNRIHSDPWATEADPTTVPRSDTICMICCWYAESFNNPDGRLVFGNSDKNHWRWYRGHDGENYHKKATMKLHDTENGYAILIDYALSRPDLFNDETDVAGNPLAGHFSEEMLRAGTRSLGETSYQNGYTMTISEAAQRLKSRDRPSAPSEGEASKKGVEPGRAQAEVEAEVAPMEGDTIPFDHDRTVAPDWVRQKLPRAAAAHSAVVRIGGDEGDDMATQEMLERCQRTDGDFALADGYRLPTDVERSRFSKLFGVGYAESLIGIPVELDTTWFGGFSSDRVNAMPMATDKDWLSHKYDTEEGQRQLDDEQKAWQEKTLGLLGGTWNLSKVGNLLFRDRMGDTARVAVSPSTDNMGGSLRWIKRGKHEGYIRAKSGGIVNRDWLDGGMDYHLKDLVATPGTQLYEGEQGDRMDGPFVNPSVASPVPFLIMLASIANPCSVEKGPGMTHSLLDTLCLKSVRQEGENLWIIPLEYTQGLSDHEIRSRASKSGHSFDDTMWHGTNVSALPSILSLGAILPSKGRSRDEKQPHDGESEAYNTLHRKSGKSIDGIYQYYDNEHTDKSLGYSGWFGATDDLRAFITVRIKTLVERAAQYDDTHVRRGQHVTSFCSTLPIALEVRTCSPCDFTSGTIAEKMMIAGMIISNATRGLSHKVIDSLEEEAAKGVMCRGPPGSWVRCDLPGLEKHLAVGGFTSAFLRMSKDVSDCYVNNEDTTLELTVNGTVHYVQFSKSWGLDKSWIRSMIDDPDARASVLPSIVRAYNEVMMSRLKGGDALIAEHLHRVRDAEALDREDIRLRAMTSELEEAMSVHVGKLEQAPDFDDRFEESKRRQERALRSDEDATLPSGEDHSSEEKTAIAKALGEREKQENDKREMVRQKRLVLDSKECRAEGQRHYQTMQAKCWQAFKKVSSNHPMPKMDSLVMEKGIIQSMVQDRISAQADESSTKGLGKGAQSVSEAHQRVVNALLAMRDDKGKVIADEERLETITLGTGLSRQQLAKLIKLINESEEEVDDTRPGELTPTSEAEGEETARPMEEVTKDGDGTEAETREGADSETEAGEMLPDCGHEGLGENKSNVAADDAMGVDEFSAGIAPHPELSDDDADMGAGTAMASEGGGAPAGNDAPVSNTGGEDPGGDAAPGALTGDPPEPNAAPLPGNAGGGDGGGGDDSGSGSSDDPGSDPPDDNPGGDNDEDGDDDVGTPPMARLSQLILWQRRYFDRSEFGSHRGLNLKMRTMLEALLLRGSATQRGTATPAALQRGIDLWRNYIAAELEVLAEEARRNGKPLKVNVSETRPINWGIKAFQEWNLLDRQLKGYHALATRVWVTPLATLLAKVLITGVGTLPTEPLRIPESNRCTLDSIFLFLDLIEDGNTLLVAAEWIVLKYIDGYEDEALERAAADVLLNPTPSDPRCPGLPILTTVSAIREGLYPGVTTRTADEAQQRQVNTVGSIVTPVSVIPLPEWGMIRALKGQTLQGTVLAKIKKWYARSIGKQAVYDHHMMIFDLVLRAETSRAFQNQYFGHIEWSTLLTIPGVGSQTFLKGRASHMIRANHAGREGSSVLTMDRHNTPVIERHNARFTPRPIQRVDWHHEVYRCNSVASRNIAKRDALMPLVRWYSRSQETLRFDVAAVAEELGRSDTSQSGTYINAFLEEDSECIGSRIWTIIDRISLREGGLPIPQDHLRDTASYWMYMEGDRKDLFLKPLRHCIDQYNDAMSSYRSQIAHRGPQSHLETRYFEKKDRQFFNTKNLPVDDIVIRIEWEFERLRDREGNYPSDPDTEQIWNRCKVLREIGTTAADTAGSYGPIKNMAWQCYEELRMRSGNSLVTLIPRSILKAEFPPRILAGVTTRTAGLIIDLSIAFSPYSRIKGILTGSEIPRFDIDAIVLLMKGWTYAPRHTVADYLSEFKCIFFIEVYLGQMMGSRSTLGAIRVASKFFGDSQDVADYRRMTSIQQYRTALWKFFFSADDRLTTKIYVMLNTLRQSVEAKLNPIMLSELRRMMEAPTLFDGSIQRSDPNVQGGAGTGSMITQFACQRVDEWMVRLQGEKHEPNTSVIEFMKKVSSDARTWTEDMEVLFPFPQLSNLWNDLCSHGLDTGTEIIRPLSESAQIAVEQVKQKEEAVNEANGIRRVNRSIVMKDLMIHAVTVQRLQVKRDFRDPGLIRLVRAKWCLWQHERSNAIEQWSLLEHVQTPLSINDFSKWAPPVRAKTGKSGIEALSILSPEIGLQGTQLHAANYGSTVSRVIPYPPSLETGETERDTMKSAHLRPVDTSSILNVEYLFMTNGEVAWKNQHKQEYLEWCRKIVALLKLAADGSGMQTDMGGLLAIHEILGWIDPVREDRHRTSQSMKLDQFISMGTLLDIVRRNSQCMRLFILQDDGHWKPRLPWALEVRGMDISFNARHIDLLRWYRPLQRAEVTILVSAGMKVMYGADPKLMGIIMHSGLRHKKVGERTSPLDMMVRFNVCRCKKIEYFPGLGNPHQYARPRDDSDPEAASSPYKKYDMSQARLASMYEDSRRGRWCWLEIDVAQLLEEHVAMIYMSSTDEVLVKLTSTLSTKFFKNCYLKQVYWSNGYYQQWTNHVSSRSLMADDIVGRYTLPTPRVAEWNSSWDTLNARVYKEAQYYRREYNKKVAYYKSNWLPQIPNECIVDLSVSAVCVCTTCGEIMGVGQMICLACHIVYARSPLSTESGLRGAWGAGARALPESSRRVYCRSSTMIQEESIRWKIKMELMDVRKLNSILLGGSIIDIRWNHDNPLYRIYMGMSGKSLAIAGKRATRPWFPAQNEKHPVRAADEQEVIRWWEEFEKWNEAQLSGGNTQVPKCEGLGLVIVIYKYLEDRLNENDMENALFTRPDLDFVSEHINFEAVTGTAVNELFDEAYGKLRKNKGKRTQGDEEGTAASLQGGDDEVGNFDEDEEMTETGSRGSKKIRIVTAPTEGGSSSSAGPSQGVGGKGVPKRTHGAPAPTDSTSSKSRRQR